MSAEAQLLYTAVESNIVTVDPVTASQITRGPALTPHLGISAIDLAGHRLFYEASVGEANVLAIFDLTTNTTTQVPLATPLAFMEFDPITDRIYGGRYDQVVSINPANGSESVLAPSSTPPYLSMGVLDVARRKLYFTATGPALTGTVLRTVNLSTGSVIETPLPSNYGFVQLDPATGKIIASSGNSIVSIDPVTGSESTLGVSPDTILGYVSAFDPITRRLFFIGSDGSQSYIVTFNLTTATLSQTSFAAGAGSTFLEYSFDVAAIPTFQGWAIILLAATLVVVALMRFP